MRDMLSAERQIVKALRKMARKAAHEDLRRSVEEHREETLGQVKRLEQAFAAVEQKPRSTQCDGMSGILEEGEQVLDQAAAPEVMDAMLIAAAQKVEHYEISTYGTLCKWANVLGFRDAERLFRQTLGEEKQTDTKLSRLATKINKKARPK
jgi:ferritin-like metal-binding protein YciE